MEEDKKKKDKQDDKENDKDGTMGFQQPAKMVNMIYGGDSSFNKRSQELVWREILKMEPAVQKPLGTARSRLPSLEKISGPDSPSQENSHSFWIQWWQVPYLLECLLMVAAA
jgi:hypothetical protein